MELRIDDVARRDYPEVIRVWEASVRDSHHFLTDADIAYFKPLILDQYLDAVKLYCVRDKSGEIIGFSGVAEDKLEMLFVHPRVIGNGIGKRLLFHAIGTHQVRKVDVNEDNPKAVEFYLHMGFRTASRSPLDSLGKPFPILHMELSQTDASNRS